MKLKKLKFGDSDSIKVAKRAIEDAARAERLQSEGKNFYCTVYYTERIECQEDVVVVGIEDEDDIDYLAAEMIEGQGGDIEVDKVTVNTSTPVSSATARPVTLPLFPESKDG